MPFQTPLAVAIYLTLWWIVLFAVLPIGVEPSHTREDMPEGSDPGAPLAPKLLMKAAITTVVSAVIFVVFVIAVKVMY